MLTIEDYQEVMKSNGGGESSLRHARLSMTYLNEFKPIEEVEYMDVVKFINHMTEVRGFKPSTVNLYKRYIKTYFSKNNRKDISDNISIKFKSEPINPETVLDVEDVNFLIENIDSVMYRAIVTFLYETGARISETVNVKYPFDIEEVNAGYDLTIRATKTNSIRKMYLIESKAYMRDWLMVRNTKSPYLFPLSPKAINTWLRHLREDLNFQKPINPHSFRHACATRLVRKGMQEIMIRTQMGWSANSKMIERYVHLAKTDLQKYQLMQIGELMPDDASMAKLTQPKETAIDRLGTQEEEINGMKEELKKNDNTISELMKVVFDLKDKLEQEICDREEEEIRQSIMYEVRKENKQTVGEIEESVKKIPDDIENSTDPEIIEGRKRAEDVIKNYGK